MADKIIITNVLKQKAEDLIQDCTNTPEGKRNYHFYIRFTDQVVGFLADLLGEADREEDEKELSKNKIISIQLINDLKDFDDSIEDGSYILNPDEAIKDHKRIMTKVRKLI